MERDTMLGKLIGWINGLPTRKIRVLYDLVEKLCGKDGKAWFIEIKRCLRKEKSWANFFRLHIYGISTTEELIKTGDADWVNRNINSQNFPMLHISGVMVWVKLVECGVIYKTTQEILAEAEEDGLQRPHYGHALLFWNQFPYEHRNGEIVFLHEPWVNSDDDVCEEVMIIDELNQGRKLSLDAFSRRWPPGTRFAFISEYGD